MKKLDKRFFIVAFLFFLAFLSCSKHDNDNDDGGDCRDIVISDDRRKLLSPQWMVHILDSLENYAFDNQVMNLHYTVLSIEYNHNTYIDIYPSGGGGLFFNCKGEKVIPDGDDPLYLGIEKALFEGNFQSLIWVNFCFYAGAGCNPRYGATYYTY